MCCDCKEKIKIADSFYICDFKKNGEVTKGDGDE